MAEPELQKDLFDLHTKIYNKIKTPTAAAPVADAPTTASVAAGIGDITGLLNKIKESMTIINKNKHNPLYNNFLKIPELTKDNLKAGQLIVDCILIRSVATTASMTNSDSSIVSSTVGSSSTIDSNNNIADYDIADDDTIRDFISSILPVNIIDSAATDTGATATNTATSTASEKLTELFTSIVSSISTASADSTASSADTDLLQNMSNLITHSVGKSILKPNIVSTDGGSANTNATADSAAASGGGGVGASTASVNDVRILTIKSSTPKSTSSTTSSSSTINIDDPLNEGSLPQTLSILHQLATIAIMSSPETKQLVLADPVNITKGNGHFIVVGKLYCINGIVIPPNFSDILNIYANSTAASSTISFANYEKYDATTNKLDDKLTDAQIASIKTSLKIDDFCPVVAAPVVAAAPVAAAPVAAAPVAAAPVQNTPSFMGSTASQSGVSGTGKSSQELLKDDISKEIERQTNATKSSTKQTTDEVKKIADVNKNRDEKTQTIKTKKEDELKKSNELANRLQQPSQSEKKSTRVGFGRGTKGGGNITKKHKQSGGNYTRKNYYD
jgi:hypothetical protein